MSKTCEIPSERVSKSCSIRTLKGIRLAQPTSTLSLGETELEGWRALKSLVGHAESEWVVIFEEDWWPCAEAGRALAHKIAEGTAGVIHFNRKDVTQEAGIDARPARWGGASHPRSPQQPGFAFAIKRQHFLELRGYDERAEYERSAGIDFQTRAEWLGLKVHQLDGSSGTVFHSATRCEGTAHKTVVTGAELTAMRTQVFGDRSIYRNLVHWSVARENRVPLITVAVATKDRGSMIEDSIYSVLYQTFQDVEIVIVDDGSETTYARDFVERLGDDRVTYVYQESLGISAARNRAADLSTCRLTAVHDDDDIMLPRRLEQGIGALTADHDASYGSWINFSDTTGEMRGFFGRLEFNSDVNAFNGQGPGHATWTLPTKLIQMVRYDEHLSASVDHNLASRLEWIGVKWKHVEQYMYMRRVHANQVTATDSHGQKIGHRLTRYANLFTASRLGKQEMETRGKATLFPKIRESTDLSGHFAGYLPDKLVNRTATFSRNASSMNFVADVPDRMRYILEDRNLLTGTLRHEASFMSPITMRDLVNWRQAGILGVDVRGEVRAAGASSDEEAIPDSFGPSSQLVQDEDSALDEVDVLTTNAAKSRMLEVVDEHLRQYPNGSAVIVSDAESYVDYVNHAQLETAVLARRIMAAGEFGVKSTYHVYGYGHMLTGLRKAAVLNSESGNNITVATNVMPADGLLSGIQES